MPVEVNDVHSRLNPTRVAEVRAVGSVEELREGVREGRGRGIALAGGRHAMGGQQFLTGGVVLDRRLFGG